jgi:hypothetical protein
MYLIQLLLPRQTRTGEFVGEAAFVRTRDELVNVFDGVTAYLRAPAQGVWTDPDGRRERDDVVMVEVLAATFDRDWWRAYGDTLRERFGQEAMHIRALPAETP